MTSAYLINAWYQAAWQSELIAGPVVRTLLDTPLLLFRDDGGQAVALMDRCPHRFAPLSKGRVEGSTVTCGYHGLAFDRTGQCIHNPHGPIPPRARVRSFPVLERHDAVWVWMGDPDRADGQELPDFSFIDTTPASAKFHGCMPTAASYQLITDNLMDLSHVGFLHSGTFGDILPNARMTVEEGARGVVVRWIASAVEPPAASPYRAFVPEGAADIWASVEWAPPALMTIDSGAVPTGVSAGESDHVYALHSLTPESPTTTHYFYCVTRRFLTDDQQVTALMKQGAEAAFAGEDKPMIEAQQMRMGAHDLFALQPLLLSIDGAAVRARRRLERLIASQSAPRAPQLQESVAG